MDVVNAIGRERALLTGDFHRERKNWNEKKKAYEADLFSYKVRDKEIQVENFTT